MSAELEWKTARLYTICLPKGVSFPPSSTAPSSPRMDHAFSMAVVFGGSMAFPRYCYDPSQSSGISTAIRRHLHIFVLTHYFNGQGDAFQWNAQNLWNWILAHIALLFPGVQLVTDSWLGSTCPASSLSSCSLGNRCLH